MTREEHLKAALESSGMKADAVSKINFAALLQLLMAILPLLPTIFTQPDPVRIP